MYNYPINFGPANIASIQTSLTIAARCISRLSLLKSAMKQPSPASLASLDTRRRQDKILFLSGLLHISPQIERIFGALPVGNWLKNLCRSRTAFWNIPHMCGTNYMDILVSSGSQLTSARQSI